MLVAVGLLQTGGFESGGGLAPTSHDGISLAQHNTCRTGDIYNKTGLWVLAMMLLHQLVCSSFWCCTIVGSATHKLVSCDWYIDSALDSSNNPGEFYDTNRGPFKL